MGKPLTLEEWRELFWDKYRDDPTYMEARYVAVLERRVEESDALVTSAHRAENAKQKELDAQMDRAEQAEAALVKMRADYNTIVHENIRVEAALAAERQAREEAEEWQRRVRVIALCTAQLVDNDMDAHPASEPHDPEDGMTDSEADAKFQEAVFADVAPDLEPKEER